MIIIEGQARFKDARDIVRLRPEIEAIINKSREEPGCLDFTVAVDVLDPCMVTIVGKWEDWKAFRRHYDQPYAVTWHENVISKAVHGHVIQVFDVAGAREFSADMFANDP